MDWLKLLTLLVAVVSIQIKADGPKKKIRIHLPQTVKHIHHHKKIYITNHPAPSAAQYAPAFMPSAEGAVAVPTNIALPAVTNIMPINSADLLEESVRVPGLTESASTLLPLYRARGYYGPTHKTLDEQDFDLAPSSDPVDSYILPSSILSTLPDSRPRSPKRVKVVKVTERPRKKIHKIKTKRGLVRKPIASVQREDEHPVSTFHEQFYSDVQDAGTIRKIKRPPRVEKIVDGNTEHIHTYSEEHVHKVIFDDEPKNTDVVGIEPIATMPSYGHPYISYKNSQLLAMDSDPYRTLTVPGSIGTPSQYEYVAYNPHEVTHDHIFHDHGEIPEEIDVTKDILSLPPKISYNSEVLRSGIGRPKRVKTKYSQRPTIPTPTDYTYYENIYSSNRVKPTEATAPAYNGYVSSHSENFNEFKPISTYSYNDDITSKSRIKIPTYFGKPTPDYSVKQSSVPAPFSVSSKIIHDYKTSPQGTVSGANSFSIYDDPFANFKDSSYVNNFNYDNYASSSNVHRSQNNNHNPTYNTPGRNDGKKSISTQNIRFGTQHFGSHSDNLPNDSILIDDNDGAPSALENMDSYDKSQMFESFTPTSYTAKESSSPYRYYHAINSVIDDHLSVPEASNDNYQYAAAPIVSTTPKSFVSATTAAPIQLQFRTNQKSADLTISSPDLIQKPKPNERYPDDNVKNTTNATPREKLRRLKEIQPIVNFYKPRLHSSEKHSHNSSPSSERSKLRYGDKI